MAVDESPRHAAARTIAMLEQETGPFETALRQRRVAEGEPREHEGGGRAARGAAEDRRVAALWAARGDRRGKGAVVVAELLDEESGHAASLLPIVAPPGDPVGEREELECARVVIGQFLALNPFPVETEGHAARAAVLVDQLAARRLERKQPALEVVGRLFGAEGEHELDQVETRQARGAAEDAPPLVVGRGEAVAEGARERFVPPPGERPGGLAGRALPLLRERDDLFALFGVVARRLRQERAQSVGGHETRRHAARCPAPRGRVEKRRAVRQEDADRGPTLRRIAAHEVGTEVRPGADRDVPGRDDLGERGVVPELIARAGAVFAPRHLEDEQDRPVLRLRSPERRGGELVPGDLLGCGERHVRGKADDQHGQSRGRERPHGGADGETECIHDARSLHRYGGVPIVMTMRVRPMRISSPSWSSAWATRRPLTKLPFVEPRSLRSTQVEP